MISDSANTALRACILAHGGMEYADIGNMNDTERMMNLFFSRSLKFKVIEWPACMLGLKWKEISHAVEK